LEALAKVVVEAAELHQVVVVYVPAEGWKYSIVPLTASEAVASVVVELLPPQKVVVVMVPAYHHVSESRSMELSISIVLLKAC